MPFTDIVDATRKAVELGDHEWRTLLEQHHAVVREHLKRFRGREIGGRNSTSSMESGFDFAYGIDAPMALRTAARTFTGILRRGIGARCPDILAVGPRARHRHREKAFAARQLRLRPCRTK
jgi:class 3 adenylate cyclase